MILSTITSWCLSSLILPQYEHQHESEPNLSLEEGEGQPMKQREDGNLGKGLGGSRGHATQSHVCDSEVPACVGLFSVFMTSAFPAGSPFPFAAANADSCGY